MGRPFTSSLAADLAGRSVSTYAVDYAANTSQTSAGPGSVDLVNHVTSVAASCPGTVFVLGGYSQGATVVDNAIGIRTTSSGSGAVLPAALASRVKAIVVFGNPLGLQRQTIETASTTHGPKAKSYCNTGDPLCGNGFNVRAPDVCDQRQYDHRSSVRCDEGDQRLTRWGWGPLHPCTGLERQRHSFLVMDELWRALQSASQYVAVANVS